jgi:hypothetical protein
MYSATPLVGTLDMVDLIVPEYSEPIRNHLGGEASRVRIGLCLSNDIFDFDKEL